jgi:D-lactate dehydrogenase (cytochrome)
MLYGNDVCVPISRLPDLVEDCKKEFKELGIYAPIVGHVGDGNFHATIIMQSLDEVPRMSEIVGKIIYRAQDMDGTCTGEHGVGMTKKKYLRRELGEGTLALMRTVKDAIDPLGIMNPGKLCECC